MGSMKAKSGGTHRYSPVSCPHPIAMECWARGRGAGSDGSSVWAELLLPMLSVLLRRAVVTGASSDLPHHAPAALCCCAGTEKEGESSCCLVLLCWNREMRGKGVSCKYRAAFGIEHV